MCTDKSQCFKDSVVWTDETKCKLLGHISSVFKGRKRASLNNAARVTWICAGHDEIRRLSRCSWERHISRGMGVKHWLKHCFEVAGMSPDLNPCEHLWACKKVPIKPERNGVEQTSSCVVFQVERQKVAWLQWLVLSISAYFRENCGFSLKMEKYQHIQPCPC